MSGNDKTVSTERTASSTSCAWLTTTAAKMLLAATLGALTVASFAPLHWFPLAWLSSGAFYWLLRQVTLSRHAWLLGFAFGLGHFLVGTSWIYVSLSVFGGLPPALAGLATLLFCTVLALFPALATALFVRFRRNRFLIDAAAFASFWILAECLRGWIFTGFPWLALGYSQSPPSPLAGYAPILGVHGLSLLTLLLGAAIAELIRSFIAKGARLKKALAPTALGIAILASSLVLSGLHWSEPHGAPLRVALLQGNVPQEMKWRPDKLAESFAIYNELIRLNPAPLTVLPETAIPTFLEHLPRDHIETLYEHASAQNGDLLFGIIVGDNKRYANAAVSLGNSPSQIYFKSHLVPFGEFVPFGFQWFVEMMHIPMGNFTAGPDHQQPMNIASQKIAVNICYEDVFGGEIIHTLSEATLLVNMSNTAWFGDSLAQPQHLQIAQLRALETGRTMLRATNTGMTAVVRPDGTVQAVLPPFIRAGMVQEVQGYVGTTPFVRWGNRFVLLLALALVISAAFSRKTQ